jgi:hypothetical protein
MGTVEKLYDLSMVEMISGGDKSFITKMIQLFIDTMPQNVSELKASLQQQNWEMLGKHAHKMKSTIDSKGISSLKEDIRTIESSGKNKTNLEAVPGLVDKTAGILDQCIQQLKNDYAL